MILQINSKSYDSFIFNVANAETNATGNTELMRLTGEGQLKLRKNMEIIHCIYIHLLELLIIVFYFKIIIQNILMLELVEILLVVIIKIIFFRKHKCHCFKC